MMQRQYHASHRLLKLDTKAGVFGINDSNMRLRYLE